MPPDLLERIHEELDERRRELAGAVEEYERLEAALAALETQVRSERQGSRGRARPRGRPRVARGERVKQLLPLLRENPEITPSELAQQLDTTRANMSVTLNRLSKQGVVSREGKRWVVHRDPG